MIKIAICDDDIDFMDKYDERIIDIFNKCTMGDETYSVVRYHSGKELLDNYKKDGADIFLLDIDLGDCKGYEVGVSLHLGSPTRQLYILLDIQRMYIMLLLADR